MKYAASITLYNPEPAFIDNLLVFATYFPLVIVNDNSKDNNAYVHRLSNIPSIHYLWDGSNWGLPAAFNRSLQICEERGIDYLCTLDQDSKLSSKAISLIEHYIENSDMSSIGIVSSAPSGIELRSEEMEIGAVMEEKKHICSGSFINLKLLKEHGIIYDEAYFVDAFDTDLCYQIRTAGLKIHVLTGVLMPHVWGEEMGYTPLRHYYIFRNRLYFNTKFFNLPESLFRSVLLTVLDCWNLRNEREPFKKIRMLPLAISDYRKGRMGEVNPQTLEKINKIVQ